MPELTKAEQLTASIAELKTALDTSNPGMATMLRTIHTALREDPTVVTLLAPEEIGVIVNGLMKQTHTTIATKAVKTGTRSTKALSKLTIDDL